MKPELLRPGVMILVSTSFSTAAPAPARIGWVVTDAETGRPLADAIAGSAKRKLRVRHASTYEIGIRLP